MEVPFRRWSVRRGPATRKGFLHDVLSRLDVTNIHQSKPQGAVPEAPHQRVEPAAVVRSQPQFPAFSGLARARSNERPAEMFHPAVIDGLETFCARRSLGGG